LSTVDHHAVGFHPRVNIGSAGWVNIGSAPTRQDDPWRIDGVQIAGAQQSLLAGQTEDALGVSVGEHGWSMFRLFVE
jgi:hypothetical protein